MSADPTSAVGHRFPVKKVSYNRRDAILYALGIGAHDLRFTFEDCGDFSVFPTYPVTLGFKGTSSDVVPFGTGMNLEIPGIQIDPSMILHGQQGIELPSGPLPLEGTFELEGQITGIYDKGSGALMTTEERLVECGCGDGGSGERRVLAVLTSGVFIRGAGGFGGPRGPSATSANQVPSRPPDHTLHETTLSHQALLYRLSGDYNPLHADPGLAEMVGFKQPILHGLCSFGYAARAVLKTFGENDPKNFKSIEVRFSSPVLPGQTLVTEMWKEQDKIIFQTKVKETGKVVIANAAVVLHNLTDAASNSAALSSSSALSSADSSKSPSCQSAEIFQQMGAVIAKSPELVEKVKAIFEFHIKDKDVVFTVDLKNAPGKVFEGKSSEKADTVFTISDEDYVAMSQGKLNPQMAFMKGKLKISGKVMLAQKLSLLSKAAAKL